MSDTTPQTREAGEEPDLHVIVTGGYGDTTTPNNLPLQLSSFVGREKELAEVKRLLEDARLVTLTGSGGCGKTRLALAAAGELAEEFEDGVWLVELASLADPSLVPQAAAYVLGVREQPGRSATESLSDYLGSRHLLLVLDNCEHLIGACATLAEALLRSCPRLCVLVTSREALDITGEVAWLVPSLSLPDLRRLPAVESLLRYESARLFMERTAAVNPNLTLTEQNASALAQICYRLDGIPLAIELAAARAKVLSVEQIAARLDDCFGLLSAGGRTAMPRHRTLHATMDWSHDLLPDGERALFRRLSVFAGGFTLEAAESVCAGEDIAGDNVLDLLSHLVDKSLVIAREEGAEARYRLLETVRQYGRTKLDESGETGRFRDRHAGYYLALAEEAEPELKAERQVAWLDRLELEHDNLRATMAWFLRRGDSEQAARLGWALWLFWGIRAHFAEGRRSMEQALSGKGSVATPASFRAKALYVESTMANYQGDHRSAESLAEESLSLFTEQGDREGMAYALSSAGFAANGRGMHEQAISLVQESVDLFLYVGERWGAAIELCFLAVAWRGRGDHSHAKRVAERGLALSREVGERQSICAALYTLATLAQAERDHGRARSLFAEGLTLSAELGNEADVAHCLEGLASVAAEEDKIARAARLWGAEEAMLEKFEAAVYTYVPDRSLHLSRVAAARSKLDEGAFEAAWAEGRKMTLEQAIEYARDRPAIPEAAVSKAYPAGLSAREAEVLRLVARGMTNAEAAAKLFISPRTVNWHLGSIYRKLGFSSRTEATRFAVEHGLH